MRWIAIVATLALIPNLARAEEPAVHLKQAPGRDVIEGYCGACHSLDYIAMNSPFLDAARWDAEVAKMIKAYGAPIDPVDAKTIGDYLKERITGSEVFRREPPEANASNLKMKSCRCWLRPGRLFPLRT